MKVFLSWAGAESEFIAETLKLWLPQVIQSLEPWMSTHIDKGDAWDGAIAAGLNESPIGILCLTKDSILSTYLHYEAGAIANVPGSKVCTFLYGIKNADVRQPLGRFQHTKLDKKEVFKLLTTINQKLVEIGDKGVSETLLIKAFDKNWPELEETLKEAPKGESQIAERPEREILEEILNIVRVKNNYDPFDMYKNTAIPADIIVIQGLTKGLENYLNKFPRNRQDALKDMEDIGLYIIKNGNVHVVHHKILKDVINNYFDNLKY